MVECGAQSLTNHNNQLIGMGSCLCIKGGAGEVLCSSVSSIFWGTPLG